MRNAVSWYLATTALKGNISLRRGPGKRVFAFDSDAALQETETQTDLRKHQRKPQGTDAEEEDTEAGMIRYQFTLAHGVSSQRVRSMRINRKRTLYFSTPYSRDIQTTIDKETEFKSASCNPPKLLGKLPLGDEWEASIKWLRKVGVVVTEASGIRDVVHVLSQLYVDSRRRNQDLWNYTDELVLASPGSVD